MTKTNEDLATPSDVDEILGLLDSFQAFAALDAALELGLFWALETGALTGENIAGTLRLPLNRCLYWLQFLCKLGLLEQTSEGFACSGRARAAIIETYSRETWTLLARESREQYPVFQFLAPHFHYPGSLWDFTEQDPPEYLNLMNMDPDRARQFTNMLFELHQGLAENLAEVLDLSGVDRVMDLGGGSGVISIALLHRYPKLRATVVDIPNVCRAGMELAAAYSIEDRLTFHPADFMHDSLPEGFDMVIECDVGVYNKPLFEKLRQSLSPGGRYVIVDQFAPAEKMAPVSRLSWALQGSLIDPDFSYPSAREIVAMLEDCGYRSLRCTQLSRIAHEPSQFTDDMYMIEVHL